MDSISNSDRIPMLIADRLRDANSKYRQRSVLSRSGDSWQIGICVIEPTDDSAQTDRPEALHVYPSAILIDQNLSTAQCLAFVSDLYDGKVSFFKTEVLGPVRSQWTIRHEGKRSTNPLSGGYVATLKFGASGTESHHSPLICATAPYYPDLIEAIRDWSQLDGYHGQSDGRNGHVIISLPEGRASFADAQLVERKLTVNIQGKSIGKQPFFIKGACWNASGIHQIDAKTLANSVDILLPDQPIRLELLLLDMDSNVYDVHREDHRFGSPDGVTYLSVTEDNVAEESLKEQIAVGEGERLEFKAFVDPTEKRKDADTHSKLFQVLQTVAAFHNTGGGRILVGVSDDCTIVGIDDDLIRMKKSKLTEDLVSGYVGEFRSRIKDNFESEVVVKVQHVQVSARYLVIIDVTANPESPINIKGDLQMYRRAGANNRRVPPSEWSRKSITGSAIWG